MKLNLQTMTEYRFDAVLSFFGSFFFNIGAILFLTFVFDKIPKLYGWDKWDMILLYGVGQFGGYLFLFSTHPNNHSFIHLIQKGNLDTIITKPINSIIHATLRVFSFEQLFGILQALGIIFYSISNKSYDINILGIAIALISTFISLVIVHLINVISLIPSFWIQRNQFYRFYVETAEISNYPYEIYNSKLLRFIFFSIIPYALLVNIPFRALIGELDIRYFLLQIFVTFIFMIVTKILWHWGLNNYQSASS